MEFKGFMEKIMQRAKSTKDVVVRKSGDVAKMTKLKMAMMTAEGKIKDAYAEIGRIVYEAYRADEGDSDAIEGKCAELDTLYAEVEALKEDYARVRNVKRCPVCQKENPADSEFCNKCGTALESSSGAKLFSESEETIVEVETAE